MSIDIPRYEDGHVLVIPKKRFVRLEDIPAKELQDLIQTVKIMGQVIKQTHTGYNLLLNNGEDAGQFILHTHFHLMPRRAHDQIKVEFFKKQKLSNKEFIAYNKLFKQQVAAYLRPTKKKK